MNSPATYVHLGFIDISVPNLALIVAMLVLFALALVIPFPKHTRVDDDKEEQDRG